jgi:hypothetical protein
MLKRVRPDFHFPPGAFFPEDETRVRWLRPDEELTVLEVMPSPFDPPSWTASECGTLQISNRMGEVCPE